MLLGETHLSIRTLDAAGAKRYRGWQPGARHGACRSKVDSSAARHGKRRDGKRRVGRSERSEREPPGRVLSARSRKMRRGREAWLLRENRA